MKEIKPKLQADAKCLPMKFISEMRYEFHTSVELQLCRVNALKHEAISY